jgi:5-aminolevulinate synthase
VRSNVALLNSTSPLCMSPLPSSTHYICLFYFLSSPGPSHIVPVLVGDAALAKAASDKLLTEHNIYVQSINYPTVAVGEERLRITVTPRHTLEQMDKLVRAVDQIFTELKINRLQDWKAAGGRAGVGIPGAALEDPMWNDQQLGLTDGTTPRTLRTGEAAVMDRKGVAAARGRFTRLLGKVEATAPVAASRPMDLASLSMKTGGAGAAMRAEEVPISAPQAVSASA